MTSSPLQDILMEAAVVGGVYQMGFHECEILTHDLWKSRAGGIAYNSLLLASPMMQRENPHDATHRYFLVLRVTGHKNLPYESELVQTRAHGMRKMMSEKGDPPSLKRLDKALNVVIANEVSFGGLQARVLGTLREDSQGKLEFRGDIDSYVTSNHYFVYKPGKKGLDLVVNHHRELPTNQKRIVRFELGEYRDSASATSAIPFHVNILDFISMKTAVLGMTRLGKSNTLKVLALGTLIQSRNGPHPIGQLIFDPTGEYAYPSSQDESTCVANVDPDSVRVYAGAGKKPPKGMNVERLTLNLFSKEDAAFVWALVQFELRERAEDAQYVANFLAQSIVPEAPEKESDEDEEADDDEEPNKYAANHKAENNRSIFYATLIKRSFEPPAQLVTRVRINKDVLDQLKPHLTSAKKAAEKANKGFVRLSTPAEHSDFWDAVVKAAPSSLKSDKLSKWLASGLWEHVQMNSKWTGAANFLRLKPYHNVAAGADFRKRILADLKEGRLVIIDVSALTTDFGARINEFIVRHITSEGLREFSETQDPPRIQVYVEEAHKFFARPADVKRKERNSPWVTLAKEAAKLRIGLVYATQEPTSVDPEIRNNTANWIVTRLNNSEELGLLGKYEDFDDFVDSIRRTEEIGFARVKTASAPITVAAQIRKFDAKFLAEVQALLKSKTKEGEDAGAP